MPPPQPSADLLRPVDRRIWRACAGSSVQIPTVNSRVYYFPQGHLEQFSDSSISVFSSLVSPLALSKPLIACQISSVHFLADPVTDEVYTKLLLVPVDHSFQSSLPSLEHDAVEDDDNDNDKIVAFAKILTPSDANNGGGFSVPRFCADSIFPPLNYYAEPPVQTLTVTDIHGVTWDFRHIYRGTPRRHLLTTGWSKFVNHKKLIAGDSVVFMRNLAGKMFIGVRRAVRSNNGGGDCARWREQIGCGGGNGAGDVKMQVKEEGFSRSGRGRVPPEAVMEAVERAAQGLPFEVVYYPRAGWYSDFVVRADVVENALNVTWMGGMRAKMAMETEDSSRMTWFQGTIASAFVPDCGPWRGSPWRMLQVTWDEPEVLQNAKKVSPWQVELVAPSPSLHAGCPPAKKFRFPENSGFLMDGEGDLFFPMSGLTNSTMGNMNQSLNYHFFPAGMQGARQNPFSVYSLPNFFSENTSQMCRNVFGNKMAPKFKTVSTELNIGSSQSDNFSPDSQSSMHSYGSEHVGNRGCNSTKVGISSFQLFGKIIHMNQPVESGFEDVGYMEDYVRKGYNENNPLDLGLTSSYTELLNRIDVQCQRASVVEACSL